MTLTETSSKTKLLQNAARCAKCNTYIYSGHRHDYVECECGAIAVDGGLHYVRWMGERDNIIDMCIEVPMDAYTRVHKLIGDTLGAFIKDNAYTFKPKSEGEDNVTALILAYISDHLINLKNENIYLQPDVEHNIKWALRTGRNELGIISAALRAYNGHPLSKEPKKTDAAGLFDQK